MPGPDQQLCVAVYRAAHAFTAVYRPLLEPFGLTYPQYVTMLTLWEAGRIGRPTATVRELGDRLDLDSGTLSPLLRRLTDAGLVVRRREGSDGRTVQVHLTEQGRALEQQLLHVPAQVAGCTQFGPADVGRLIGELHALTDQLRGAEV
ncbi:MarR family transcriptional regulator [Nakamurella sp. YIM 132087]|uniref:MarR family transcriptional regulator n=1 Tax=Nakamurella alba TaxID=2665158 RepID=A0A7K1FPW2_9ACTN|nr:MarR family transcriptional regulator [Nakamurella alba]MTD15283.1 MarR family transcriptional regulator [Nakamurella alba]